MPTTEQTPLLWNGNFAKTKAIGEDVHAQFCSLTGCPPSNAPTGYRHNVNSKSIYGRAKAGLHSQQNTYYFTAALTNTLLLSQVVLGAALTALGAAKVPYIMVTIFGAANTIIAGLVAYLKSRGQPMRSRMYRDDLERVVDEIENSEVMWLGISQRVNGYSELIDGKDRVTVRDEVARLTRLYDRAVRTNNLNNPDLYSAGGSDPSGSAKQAASAGASSSTQQPAKAKEPVEPSPTGTGGQGTSSSAAPQDSSTTPVPATSDPDQSPASAPPASKKTDGTDNKPVYADTDKGQPAAARESDLKSKDKDKDSSTSAPTKSSDANADPSSSSPSNESPKPDKADKSVKAKSGTAPAPTLTPPSGAMAPHDAPPSSMTVVPLSVADVDQSPATKPRVGGGASGSDDGNKKENGSAGAGGQGGARKVAGDSE